MSFAPSVTEPRRFQAPLPASSTRVPDSLWVTNWQSIGSAPALPSAECDRLVEDLELIRRVSNGDQEAARSMVARLRPAILKCIRNRLPRWTTEEDLLQSVFTKIFTKLHQFSGTVPLECWVTRIAVNTSLNQLAYESVRPEWRMSDLSEEQVSVLENRIDPAVEAEKKQDARELVDLMLSHLDPDERLIITLLHIEQRSTTEISRMTGLSVSLVKVKAFRTRKKMRRIGQRLRM